MIENFISAVCSDGFEKRKKGPIRKGDFVPQASRKIRFIASKREINKFRANNVIRTDFANSKILYSSTNARVDKILNTNSLLKPWILSKFESSNQP